MENFKSINEFQAKLLTDPKLMEDFKADPVKVMEQIRTSIPDTRVYRLVVGALGGAILLVILGIVVLLMADKNVDSATSTLFTAIASGAVGALAGLLAPSPK